MKERKENDGLKRFEAWCRDAGESPEAGGWTTFVYFIRDLAARGESLPVVREVLRDVGRAWRAQGRHDPTLHERVQAELELQAETPGHNRAPLAEPESGIGRSGLTTESTLPMKVGAGEASPATKVELLQEVPEEELWLQGQRSSQTRRAYRADIRHFIETLSIRSAEELRKVDRAAVIHWQREMEREKARPRTIRRRLSALSSLFTHLVSRRAAEANPCREVKRPRVNRKRGETKAFSVKQARAILDAPDLVTARGLRDRAILSIGLQVGARRSEIARLAVKDFHQNQGYWSLHFVRKGGEDHSVSVNPKTAQRIHEYLAKAGHGDDREGPLFRPLSGNGQVSDPRRHLHPEMVDRILKKYARRLGLGVEFSAHSMRATFITTALDKGCSLEDVQRDVGHADPTTTKLYDRRGHNPEKSASFFANY